MTVVLSSLSLEYVRAHVRARLDGAVVDPTADVVAFAFLIDADAEPGALDWVAGSWETDQSKYYARCLVGPGFKVLADGDWYVWLKITDTPEIPVRRIGKVSIS